MLASTSATKSKITISSPEKRLGAIDSATTCSIVRRKATPTKMLCGGRALAVGIELDGARSELESVEPHDIRLHLVELDGRCSILFNQFRRGDSALPSLPLGHGL